MHQVQHRWRTGNSLKDLGVIGGGGIQIRVFHRHRVNLVGRQRRVGQKAFAQMREVSVGIASGRNAFVHLHDVEVFPGNRFVGERAEHLPRCLASADGHDEPAARRHRRTRLGCDEASCGLRHRRRFGKYFNPHGRVVKSVCHFHLPVTADEIVR